MFTPAERQLRKGFTLIDYCSRYNFEVIHCTGMCGPLPLPLEYKTYVVGMGQHYGALRYLSEGDQNYIFFFDSSRNVDRSRPMLQRTFGEDAVFEIPFDKVDPLLIRLSLRRYPLKKYLEGMADHHPLKNNLKEALQQLEDIHSKRLEISAEIERSGDDPSRETLDNWSNAVRPLFQQLAEETLARLQDVDIAERPLHVKEKRHRGPTSEPDVEKRRK